MSSSFHLWEGQGFNVECHMLGTEPTLMDSMDDDDDDDDDDDVEFYTDTDETAGGALQQQTSQSDKGNSMKGTNALPTMNSLQQNRKGESRIHQPQDNRECGSPVPDMIAYANNNPYSSHDGGPRHVSPEPAAAPKLKLPDLYQLQLEYKRSIRKLATSMRRSDATRNIVKRQRLYYESDEEPRPDFFGSESCQRLEESRRKMFRLLTHAS